MLRFLGRAIHRNNPELTRLYDSGKLFITQGDLLAAKESFTKVLQIDPACEGAMYRLLEIEKKLKDHQNLNNQALKESHSELNPKLNKSP